MIVWAAYVFIFFAISVDRGWRTLSSSALWIPALWFALLSSRAPSFWLSGGAASNLEGSYDNIVVYNLLIFGALWVLKSRKFSWSQFVRENPVLTLLYVFFAVSALWSEFPFSSFKRWFTNFGHIPIALVVITDSKPAEALRGTLVRVAYALLPLSVVFIRFVSHLGRNYSRTGEVMVTGVAEHKNQLGVLVVIVSLALLWDFLAGREGGPKPQTAFQKLCRLGLLANAMYLLIICRSATALICFGLGAVLLMSGKYLASFGNAKSLIAVAAFLVVGALVVDGMFDLKGTVLTALGRDASLTGRSEIWADIASKHVGSFLGSGYRAFWDSEGTKTLWEANGRNQLMSAHNGYIETYLSGGVVGVVLLGVWLISSCGIVVNRLVEGDPLGKLSVPIWVIAIVSNNSESSFLMQSPLWFAVLIVSIRFARSVGQVAATPKRTAFRAGGSAWHSGQPLHPEASGSSARAMHPKVLGS